ncbi:MFS transporter [Actinomadura graeca]|uniref:MFS transporter n=1 Tax=Actinomadura graeca TaxID=2750812 RepID=A0ABX8QS33_9ACTN|nr:MFS transporter [Actinomadura graeca]QXJ21629.1 MFS transporter [Actinomadura graeca]
MRGPRSRYYALRAIGWLADQLLLFLVPVLAFKLTGSLAWSGIALTAQWAPRLIALPVGGLLADRFDVTAFYVVNDLVRCMAGLAGVLAIILFPDEAGATVIVFSVVAGVCCEQTLVAGEKLAGRLIPPEIMPGAQSLLGSLEQGALLLAPAIGGGLVLLDTVWTALVITMLFFVSLAIAFSLPEGRRTEKPDRPISGSLSSLAGELATGLRTIGRIPVLLGIVVATMLVNLLLGAIQTAAPDLVVRSYGHSEGVLGTMYTVAGIAAMAAMPAMNRLIRRFGLLAVAAAASLTQAVVFTLLTSASLFWVFAGLVAVFMIGDSMFTVVIRIVRITVVRPDEFGRTVAAIHMLNFAPVPLVGLILAAADGRVPLGIVIPTIGLVTLVSLALLMRRLRPLVAACPDLHPLEEKRKARALVP